LKFKKKASSHQRLSDIVEEPAQIVLEPEDKADVEAVMRELEEELSIGTDFLSTSTSTCDEFDNVIDENVLTTFSNDNINSTVRTNKKELKEEDEDGIRLGGDSEKIRLENIQDSKEFHTELQANVAAVHLEIAYLEAAGRFTSNPNSKDIDPDVPSCLFHIIIAGKLGNRQALLALGRLRLGIGSSILDELSQVVSEDRQKAVLLLEAAARRGSVAGACLAAQIRERDRGEKNILWL